MEQLVLWLYMINFTLLIIHEMDSAYQEEWKLFKLKGGVDGFLLIHFPVLMTLLYGLLELSKGTQTGLFFSLVLSIVGIGALIIHSTFWRFGHPEFKSLVSKTILFITMLGSLIQGIMTLVLLHR